MKKHLMVLLLLSSQASLAAKIKYNYEVKSSLNENINGFVVDDKVGRDVEELALKAGLKRKFKLPKKFKLTFQTSLNLQLHNLGDSFEGADLRNLDNVNTTLKKVSITPKVSFSKKLTKNFILNGGAELEAGRGYSISQAFQNRLNTPSDNFSATNIGYFIIDDPYFKYSFNLGAAIRLNKKVNFRGLYKFTEYNHEKNYTFLEEQGTNDRRIHTLGLLGSVKPVKAINISLSAQLDDITYRDRLALENSGVFTRMGIGEASNLRDFKVGLNLKLLKIVSIKLERKDREDLVKNGDGSVADKIELKFTKSLKKLFDIALSYSQTNTEYKNQQAFQSFTTVDPSAPLREDNNVTIEGSISKRLTFLGKKAPKLKFHVQDIKITSNNLFGEYDNQVIGLALNGNF